MLATQLEGVKEVYNTVHRYVMILFYKIWFILGICKKIMGGCTTIYSWRHHQKLAICSFGMGYLVSYALKYCFPEPSLLNICFQIPIILLLIGLGFHIGAYADAYMLHVDCPWPLKSELGDYPRTSAELAQCRKAAELICNIDFRGNFRHERQKQILEQEKKEKDAEKTE